MNYFENIPISKYRNAIYGIATLGIIASKLPKLAY